MSRSKGIMITEDVVTQFASKANLQEDEAREIINRSTEY